MEQLTREGGEKREAGRVERGMETEGEEPVDAIYGLMQSL